MSTENMVPGTAPRPRPVRHDTPLRAQPRRSPAPARRSIDFTRLLTLLCSLLMLGAGGYGVNLAVQKVNAQKIERVHLEGTLSYVTEDEIKATVGVEVSTSLIAVDLEDIKQKLEALPWIRKAEVRRQWPDTLNIFVEEEIPIARWGADQLLNQQGQVFQPDDTEEQQTLPLLAGPERSEQKVMRQYQEFNQLLYPLGVRIRDLTLNDSGSYELTLTNGVQVRLGRESVLDRLRRLVVFLESEHGRDLQTVQSIDLRYRNGLAVARRPEVSGAAEQQERAGSLVIR